MFRNYAMTTLRNLMRNRLYTVINVVGLAVGFAAALLIAVFVRDELSYDTWIPGHSQIFRVSEYQTNPGEFAPYLNDPTLGYVASWMRSDFPEVEATARLALPSGAQVSLRQGTREINLSHFYWGDTNFFEVLALPVIAGDLRTALLHPHGIVLTRTTARRLFGRDDPIGEALEIDRDNIMVVTAVLEDLPSNTHLAIEAIASGAAPFSELVKSDAETNPNLSAWAFTYVRLKTGTDVERLRQALPDLVDRHLPPGPYLAKLNKKSSERVHLVLRPVTEVHLSPSGWSAMKPGASLGNIYAITVIGALILLVAAINFVNLTTARAARRAAEIGVRKVSGALRRNLIAQFMGEAVLLVAVAAAVAFAVAITMLPAFAAYLQRDLAAPLDAMLVSTGLVTIIAIGVMAGAYPALVLSAFRPAAVLKGAVRGGGSGFLRQALVVTQFAVLVGLALATMTIQRQMKFVADGALHFDRDQTVLIDTAGCPAVLRDRIRAVPGVLAAACSGKMLENHDLGIFIKRRDGTQTGVRLSIVDDGLLELYGFAPVAGRFFDGGRGETTARPEAITKTGGALVINQSAVRRLGYDSPEDVIGERVFGADGPEVIGVAPDFSMRSLRKMIEPTIYVGGPRQRNNFDTLDIKLRGDNISATLRAIDEIWNKAGDRPGPIVRRFFDQYTQSLYTDVTRQGEMFTVFAGVTLLLSVLGMFGLSAFTAEQRTKEIGVRKAMGARTADVLRLLIWQFCKPVLWANALAWPAAYILMQRWLEGFAVRIDLALWMFLAASLSALMIAVLTVAGHALLIARAQPVTALRYE